MTQLAYSIKTLKLSGGTSGKLLYLNADKEVTEVNLGSNLTFNSGVLNAQSTTSVANLTTARTISASGDGSWTVTFDGSQNVTSAFTLNTVNTAVTTLGFKKITVNDKGLTTDTTDVTSSDIVAVLGYTPVNQTYVDNLVNGLAWKDEVVLALDTNVTLSGAQTLQTVSLAVDDSVLVMGQTDQTKNGIYLVKSGAWVRRTDSDTTSKFKGAVVSVTSGTYANKSYICSSVPATLGTDNVVFSRLPGAGEYTAGSNVTISGNVIALASDISLNSVTTSKNVIGVIEQSQVSVSINTASPVIVDTFAKSTYRSAKYSVQVSDSPNFETLEVSVLHDGTTAYITSYGNVFNGSNSLGDFDANINGNNIEVSYTATASTNKTIRMLRTLNPI
jgi:hypothetical protein